MNKNSITALLGAAALMSGSTLAVAQVSSGPVRPQYEIPTGDRDANPDAPRGVMLTDGVALYPYANVGVGRDDNLFLTNTNKKSSTLLTAAPGFKLQARNQTGIYTLDVDGRLGRYQSSRDDDYADYHVGATGEFVMSSRMGFRVLGEYNKGHDPRGSTDRPFGAEPDEFNSSGVSGLFAFGGNEARGRIELEGSSYRKRYENNRSYTIFGDRDNENIAGRFFVRFAPKTSFLVEARHDKFDYVLATSLQDSYERRYLAGVTWEATAATTGTVKVGRIEKNFKSPLLSDFSGTGWEAIVTWSPLTYSKFDFFTQKTFSESTGFGDFALSKRYGAAWTHRWNSRLSTTANVYRSDDDFIGRTSRNDTTDNLGFKIDYKFYRGFSVGGEYTYTDRDSNLSAFKYKRNVYMLTLGATL